LLSSSLSSRHSYHRTVPSFPTRRSSDLFDWVKANRDGNIQRKSGSIIALDQQGNAIVRWDFREAWPSRYDGPDFEYADSEITIEDRKSTRLNSSHVKISYAVFCLKKKKT